MAKGLKKRAAKRVAEQEAAASSVKVARVLPDGVLEGKDTMRLADSESSSDGEEEEIPEHDKKEVRLSAAAEKRIKTAVDAKKSKDGKDGKDGVLHNRSKGATKPTPDNAAVVYLGHIPYGFFERQMTEYFGQFGVVTRLRISRSMRTGRSRGFAFIEFADAEVAEVVAETMNGYIMFDRVLKCEVMPKEKVHAKLFQKQRRVPHRMMAREHHNRSRTEEEHAARIEKLQKKETTKRARLEKLGIEYDFKGYCQ